MEVITISSEAFQKLTERLENIESYFKHIAMKQPLSEPCLDVEEVCKLLKISKRTLQKYRMKGMITYSQAEGKIYIFASDLEEFIRNHTRKAFAKPQKNL